MFHTHLDATEIEKVQEFVLAERAKCLSDREWQFRLRGYGYGVRPSDQGRIVTALAKNTDLFEIDEATLNAPVVVAD